MAYGGSEEGYQLFGPNAMPDKNQQFLDQSSRMQDQNRDDSRWLAEEQLQNTRTTGQNAIHAADQGFSQYNIGNQRADQNQQRGIDNARAADTQGMEHTRLAMDQKSRGLADQGTQINLDKLTQEQAFQNGTDPTTGKSRFETLQGGKYADENANYGPNGRNAQTFAMDMSKGKANINEMNANAGNIAEQRSQNRTLFSQGQGDRSVDMVAKKLLAARSQGNGRLEEQVITDARNQGMQQDDIARAQGQAASSMRQSQESNDIVERAKPGVQDLLNNAQSTREKLVHLGNISQQAKEFQHQTVGSPEEAAARTNFVSGLRQAGKNQEADFVENGGKNSIRLPGGASLSTNGRQSEGSRVKAALKNMETEVAGQIKQLEGRAGATQSPTVVREIQSLKQDLAQIQAQNQSALGGDGPPRLVGGGGISNASMFTPPEQLPGAKAAKMPQPGALPISFQGGQPDAYGKPAATPSLRMGGQ